MAFIERHVVDEEDDEDVGTIGPVGEPYEISPEPED